MTADFLNIKTLLYGNKCIYNAAISLIFKEQNNACQKLLTFFFEQAEYIQGDL